MSECSHYPWWQVGARAGKENAHTSGLERTLQAAGYGVYREYDSRCPCLKQACSTGPLWPPILAGNTIRWQITRDVHRIARRGLRLMGAVGRCAPAVAVLATYAMCSRDDA